MMNRDCKDKGGWFYVWMVVMVTSILFSGCAERLQVRRLKPAEINVSGYNKIAVAQFTGRNAPSVVATLEQALMDSGRFEVLDRSNLGKIMQEQGFSQSGAVDENAAVQVGKMVGSAALVFGNVSRRDYKQDKTYSDRYCQDQNKRTFVCGKIYHVTGKWHEQVQFKVVDTVTGKIIATRNIPAEHQQYVSENDAIPAINWDPEEVMSRLDRQVVSQFMKAIAPYHVVEQVTLHKDKKLPELEAGINCCKAGQWATAVDQFRAAVEKADTMPGVDPKLRARARYNLGVALGYSGSYDEGIREIEKAMQINPEPEFAGEIAKIKMFKRDAERLRDQGVDIPQASRRIRIIVVG